MSDYEGKLGEWLKYVQQQVASVGKKDEEEKPEDQPKAEQTASEQEPADEGVGRVIMRDRFGSLPIRERENVDMDSIVADSSLIEEAAPAGFPSAPLFDETDVPNVEDFLPFLREPASEPERESAPEPEPWKLNEQNLNLFAEGTGEPKPLIRATEEPRAEAQPVMPAEPKPVLRAVVKPPVQPRAREDTEIAPPRDAQASWDIMPKHLQILFSQPADEIAQNSYKQFKESRHELIARLLDPTISLEEAARVLDVCPTTVRRYTNRGALPHFRTAGNQRRFRLSDVLAFLETSGRNTEAASSRGKEES